MTSVRVEVGIRKLAGGCSWLFDCTLVLNVGANAPAAAATRVSLICGSSRSVFRSTLCSSASLTASSTVSRSPAADAGVAPRRRRPAEREQRGQRRPPRARHVAAPPRARRRRRRGARRAEQPQLHASSKSE
jgi:hypothetical protein